MIRDAASQRCFKGKSVALNPLEEEQAAFLIKENITELQEARALSPPMAAIKEVQEENARLVYLESKKGSHFRSQQKEPLVSCR